jgi:peroxisome-assembly ATPase
MRSIRDYRRISDDESIYYFLQDQSGWKEMSNDVLGNRLPPKTLSVYSRPIQVNCIGESGAAKFDFSELCLRNLGPADYITIASTFPIIIIDNVPILTLIKKNEARRFITLLDALYECRVKLLIRAASPPETLFFPDVDMNIQEDLLWTESYSKAQLDMTTPYRPNVSTYTGKNETQDVVKTPLVDRPVDSTKLTAFTGEDERFAFRRAVSRLFEMPSKRWWETQTHIPMKSLPWTNHPSQNTVANAVSKTPEFRDGASPFRRSKEKPPSFFKGHFWGVMRWGRKAGRWGMGIHFHYLSHLGTDALHEKGRK